MATTERASNSSNNTAIVLVINHPVTNARIAAQTNINT